MIDNRKHFKLVTGAELIFYNLDSVKDCNDVVICEGECDCLAFIEAGIENVISVPNGAQIGTEHSDYIKNCLEYFEDKDKIYLATDNDEKGLHLRNELLRRFGADKCFKIDFKECKDANEYLLRYGKEALKLTIKDAEPFPIDGIVFAEDLSDDIDDLFNNGFPEAIQIGWSGLDEHMRIETGRLMIVTGNPSAGKSAFCDELMTLTAKNHNWKWGIFSPENFPLELHILKLAQVLIGKSYFIKDNKMSYELLQEAKKFINEHFYFIFPDEDKFNVEYVIERAKMLIFRYGIKGFIIDNWASLEYQFQKKQSETLYISGALEKLRNLARLRDILTVLVAHPAKPTRDTESKCPTLYSISGSAHFKNKADIGIALHRIRNEDEQSNEGDLIQVHIQKLRFQHLGKEKEIDFKYNINNGRFCNIDGNIVRWDNTNWLLEPKLYSQVNESFEPNLNFDNKEITEIPF